MKTCSKCNTEKDLSLFVKDKRRIDGRGSWCKRCHSTYAVARKLKCTEEKVIEMWQIEECEVCGTHLSGSEANIDHCHRTGQIRGVLCNPCNRALGFVENRLYHKLLEYKQKYERKLYGG